MLRVFPNGAASAVKLFEGSFEDRYNDPGQPFLTMNAAGKMVVETTSDASGIYLHADGASPEGDQPFVAVMSTANGESKRLWQYFVAGLMLGLAVMVRSEVLLFPVLLLVYLLFAAKGWAQRRKVVERIAVLALGTAAVMSPWIIRNYRLVHSFVPTATIAGLAAQAGLYTCENTSLGEPFFLADGEAGLERKEIARQLGIPFIGPYFQLFYTPQDELAFYQALLNRVSTEYRSHPEVLAGCAAKNLFFNFWFLGKTPKAVLLNVFVQAPLLALALAGVVVLWKRKLLGNAAIILLYILYIPALHAPMVAEARYSMLIAPFLAILAAVFLLSAWYTLRARLFRRFMSMATSEEQGSA